MTDHTIRVVYLVFLAVGAIASWGFVFRYFSKFKWYNNVLGRHLMAVSTVCGLIYTWNFFSIIFFLTSNSIPRLLIGFLLFVLFTFVLVWRWVIFERLARSIDNKDGKMSDADTDGDSIDVD
jgi:hypothetical protein